MNSIGFRNFRRFQNFPEIDLGDITILVGGNNAGKSTLVKAMLLMRDFLKSRVERIEKTNNKLRRYAPQFNFDTEHVNIGDFYRAFCRQSPAKDNTLSFTMRMDKFRFAVSIRGARKPGIIPQVSMIAVSDEERDIHFEFDFSKGQMKIRFEYDKDALNNDINETKQIHSRIKQLKEKLSQSKDFDEISNIKIEIENLERMNSFANTTGVEISEYNEVTIDLVYFKGENIGNLVIPELVKAFVYYSETGTIGDKRSTIYKEKVAKKTFIRGKASVINSIAEELERVLNGQVIEYIYAHSVVQNAIYANCAASNDYTKRTIHEFYNARISSDEEEFLLIEEWLKEFNIGKSLKVIPYGGDNYRVLIFDKNNPEIKNSNTNGYPGGIDLADKGMGSIQLVILLLRVATLMRKFHGQQLTILLEEPEQNLHPAIQSKLAEFLYLVNRGFKINFIIETHSEYLIRKTQVIVAEQSKPQNNIDNPFKVIYLPDNNEPPYDMQYRPDGKFMKDFGPGFFDEAANLAFEIF